MTLSKSNLKDAAIFCLLLCLAILIGCGSISDKGIRDAYKECEQHGGLALLSPGKGTVNSFEVVCGDGTTINVLQAKP